MIIKYKFSTQETQVIHEEGDREHIHNMITELFEQHRERRIAWEIPRKEEVAVV